MRVIQFRKAAIALLLLLGTVILCALLIARPEQTISIVTKAAIKTSAAAAAKAVKEEEPPIPLISLEEDAIPLKFPYAHAHGSDSGADLNLSTTNFSLSPPLRTFLEKLDAPVRQMASDLLRNVPVKLRLGVVEDLTPWVGFKIDLPSFVREVQRWTHDFCIVKIRKCAVSVHKGSLHSHFAAAVEVLQERLARYSLADCPVKDTWIAFNGKGQPVCGNEARCVGSGVTDILDQHTIFMQGQALSSFSRVPVFTGSKIRHCYSDILFPFPSMLTVAEANADSENSKEHSAAKPNFRITLLTPKAVFRDSASGHGNKQRKPLRLRLAEHVLHSNSSMASMYAIAFTESVFLETHLQKHTLLPPIGIDKESSNNPSNNNDNGGHGYLQVPGQFVAHDRLTDAHVPHYRTVIDVDGVGHSDRLPRLCMHSNVLVRIGIVEDLILRFLSPGKDYEHVDLSLQSLDHKVFRSLHDDSRAQTMAHNKVTECRKLLQPAVLASYMEAVVTLYSLVVQFVTT